MNRISSGTGWPSRGNLIDVLILDQFRFLICFFLSGFFFHDAPLIQLFWVWQDILVLSCLEKFSNLQKGVCLRLSHSGFRIQ